MGLGTVSTARLLVQPRGHHHLPRPDLSILLGLLQLVLKNRTRRALDGDQVEILAGDENDVERVTIDGDWSGTPSRGTR